MKCIQNAFEVNATTTVEKKHFDHNALSWAKEAAGGFTPSVIRGERGVEGESSLTPWEDIKEYGILGAVSWESPSGPEISPDWVRITLKKASGQKAAAHLQALFRKWRPDLATTLEPSDRGCYFYGEGIRLYIGKEFVAGVYWGGQNEGSTCIDLCGGFCGRVSPDFWRDVVRYLKCLKRRFSAKITRLDLALDFFRAEVTPHDVREAYLESSGRRFMCGGRPPKPSQAGDWDTHQSPVTYYVGKRGSGKMLRAYEKGWKETGRPHHPWMRLEVEFTGKYVEEIPFDALLSVNWASYFAGAYPYLADLIADQPRKIKTSSSGSRQEKAIGKLVRAIEFGQKQFGKSLDAIAVHFGDAVALQLVRRDSSGSPLRSMMDLDGNLIQHCQEAAGASADDLKRLLYARVEPIERMPVAKTRRVLKILAESGATRRAQAQRAAGCSALGVGASL